MVLFEKTDFGGNYLNFDANFNLEITDKSKVVFAPNGTCKTTIYNCIKNKHPELEFIDYDELKQSIIDNKKELIIGTNIVQLLQKQNEKKQIFNEIDIAKTIKSLGITNSEADKKISNNFKRNAESFEKMLTEFAKDEVQNIIDNLGTDGVFFAKNYKLISEATDVTEELQKIKDKYLKTVFDNLNNILSDEEEVCPICGHNAGQSIKNLIATKKAELSELSNELVELYCESRKEISPADVIEKINNIINFKITNNINETAAVSFLIVGGDASKLNQFSSYSSTIKNLNREINNIEIQRDEFYNKLKLAERKIKDLFCNELKVDERKIILDNTLKVLKITLDREVKTYSTGEINLMVLIVNLYQFIYSDKEILVLDDPLSSYDIVNQYRIIYEIVCALTDNKKVLILTHNIEALNMLNCQDKGKFEQFAIEKSQKNLVINHIFTQETNAFNIDTLLLENTSNDLANYISLLIKRENINSPDDIHLIFHYDEPHAYIDENSVEYKNDILVELIENFTDTTLSNIDFYKNSFNKIIYLAALRVWIEKQFYNTLGSDTNLIGKTLGEKIQYIFPEDGIVRWTGSPNVNKKILMSKKVMLNQNNHYKSQIAPFYYALNLSLDDITREILNIKNMFE